MAMRCELGVDGQSLVIALSGCPTDRTLPKWVARLCGIPQGSIPENLLIDCRHVTDFSRLSHDGVYKSAISAMSHSHLWRRVAMVVASPLAHGLANMFLTYGFCSKAHVVVAHNYDDALVFLLERNP